MVEENAWSLFLMLTVVVSFTSTERYASQHCYLLAPLNCGETVVCWTSEGMPLKIAPNVVKSVKSVDLVSLDESGTLLVFVSSLQAHKMTNG
jgi:hypothetical protein